MPDTNTPPEESSPHVSTDIAMPQAEAGDSRIEPRARLHRITRLPDDPWLLNGYTGVGEEGQYFYVTYISRSYSWHRLNVLVKRSRETGSTRQTIDLKIAAATAVSPEDGSRMIFGYVCSLLQEALVENTIRKLIISHDYLGNLDFQFSQDDQEMTRLSSLSELHSSWAVPVIRKIKQARHTGAYTYKTQYRAERYTFVQTPDTSLLDNFLYELHVLNSTIRCPYMSNLAYVVYEGYLRGYLLDEQLGRETLYVRMMREYNEGSLIPWHVRRRWAVQIVFAIQTLHAEGFVHGSITPQTIFLVEESRRAAERTTASAIVHNISVSCPKLAYETAPPEVFLAPELISRSTGTQCQQYSSTQTDIYALGVVLWSLAVQWGDPQEWKQNKGRLGMSRRPDRSKPEVPTWSFPVRDAIQACWDAQPSERPTTDFLLRVLEQDGLEDLGTNPEPEPEVEDDGSVVPRSDVAEFRQAVAALTADLRGLSMDDGFAGPAPDTYEELEVEPEYNMFTAEQRKLAEWDFKDKLRDYMVRSSKMSQDAGVETELLEEARLEWEQKKSRWW